eukprot:Hpha_TRINITY_DN5711_c0_g1::TRINITY_DN5711_c0_g1_i1::g.147659::m.147659
MFVASEESFEDKEPWRKRRPAAEGRYLKWANIIVFVAAFSAFLLVVHKVDDRAGGSVTDFWSPGRFQLSEELAASLAANPGCSHQQTVSIRAWEPTVMLNETTRDFIMAESAGLIRTSIYATGAALFADLLNKVLFFLNLHEVGTERWVISKGYLLLLEVGLIAWALAALEQPTSQSGAVSEYLKKCAPGRAHVWDRPPFIEMYVMLGVTLLLYIINWALYIMRNYPYSVRSRAGNLVSLKPWPVVRRHWRAIGTVLTTRPPDTAPPGAESQQTQIVDSVVDEIRTLRNELHELAFEYRSRAGNPPV